MYEQYTLFEITPPREAVINRLNAITEQQWDLRDQVAQLELGRTALFAALREQQ